MGYNFDENINKILTKKFASKIHAGYDPNDVDSFFDDVITYLQEVKKLADENLKVKDDYIQQINKLEEENNELKKQIATKDNEISMYRNEGYTNIALQKRISKLEELEKEKQEKK